MHFDTIIISRAKDIYSVLKTNLKFSINNLIIVVDSIETILMN